MQESKKQSVIGYAVRPSLRPGSGWEWEVFEDGKTIAAGTASTRPAADQLVKDQVEQLGKASAAADQVEQLGAAGNDVGKASEASEPTVETPKKKGKRGGY